MLPAAILIMIPMHHLESIFWWEDLIRYPIYLVVIGFAVRFVVCLCKALTTKDFSWKYVFLGYKWEYPKKEEYSLRKVPETDSL
jgi:hypothetical protein